LLAEAYSYKSDGAIVMLLTLLRMRRKS